MSHSHWAAPLLLCLFANLTAQAEAPAARTDGTVRVRPEMTDEILANPGMGWETFHHPARKDSTLPSWIPSTVEYVRWGWRELEPRPGVINTALIDRTLNDASDSGQRLAFRVMCCSTSRNAPYHPAWLTEFGAREVAADYEGTRFRIPDFEDPVTLERHLDFIRRLGARYDGHPNLDHVDLGSIGWWGEWHLSGGKNPMPSAAKLQKVVDTYAAAFRKTPLLMLIGGREALRHARDLGAGWRADCLGDLGGFSGNWCHMRKGYPLMVKEGGVGEVWKTSPVAWETCWDMRKWVREGWSLRYIFNYALALHGSYINNKSAPLPEAVEVRPELERFLRRLGYRLVLDEMTYPSVLRHGAPLPVRMTWHNAGSAPCYRPYRVAYRLSGGSGRDVVIAGGVTVQHWLPGTVEPFTEAFLKEPPDLPPGDSYPVEDRVPMPLDLAPGRYTLSVGVVGHEMSKPIVRLGIKGRDSEGWYPLGQIDVQR